jgi:UDP-3-O-[3-hydroxymyristoyl] glucosamine N-acyltransferase
MEQVLEMSQVPSSADQRRVAALASKVNAAVAGDESMEIRGVCSLEEPASAHLSFDKSVSIKKLQINLKKIAVKPLAVLVRRDTVKGGAESLAAECGLTLLVVEKPFEALLDLVPLFYTPPKLAAGVSARAEVSPTAILGQGVSVGAFSVIGDEVVIGDGVTIHPQVVVYPGARIGARSVIHAGAVIREFSIIGADCVVQPGAVIGADGFGYVPDPKLGLRPVPQIGITQLEDRVDIGANACVDRGAFGRTKIGMGSKLDNLVQVGHNTTVGRFSIACGQTGIAGSCTIGNQVVLGGQVGVADHIKIADGVRVAAQSGVTGHLETRGDYAGFPAIPAAEWRRRFVKGSKPARSENAANETATQKTSTNEGD